MRTGSNVQDVFMRTARIFRPRTRCGIERHIGQRSAPAQLHRQARRPGRMNSASLDDALSGERRSSAANSVVRAGMNLSRGTLVADAREKRMRALGAQELAWEGSGTEPPFNQPDRAVFFTMRKSHPDRTGSGHPSRRCPTYALCWKHRELFPANRVAFEERGQHNFENILYYSRTVARITFQSSRQAEHPLRKCTRSAHCAGRVPADPSARLLVLTGAGL